MKMGWARVMAATISARVESKIFDTMKYKVKMKLMEMDNANRCIDSKLLPKIFIHIAPQQKNNNGCP